jgi:uncharacterized protein (TIGR02391 family)
MIDWKLIAQRLAESADGGVILMPAHLQLQALFVHNIKIEEYLTDKSFTDTYRTVYNLVMSIKDRKGLTEKNKLQTLMKFTNKLSVSQDYITELLKEAGYTPSEPPDTPDLQRFNARTFHPEIVSHCEKFFIQGHYFVAVAEASKAYNIAVKKKLGGTAKDGRDLMLSEFGQDKRIRAVSGNSDSEKNFLDGIKFLSAGLIQSFRNPTSHETMKTWKVDEQDCLDILSLASYLFRQLDKAIVHP